MCQLPLINMCVARIRSPEKWMSSHLPRDSTCSMVRPATGDWSFPLANCAYAVSKSVTVLPANAWCRARVERKMVSPSGMRSGSSAGQHSTPEVQAVQSKMETRVLKKGGEEVLCRRLTIDRRDEHSAPLIFAPLHFLLGQ